ncbi:hypothetical protein [Zunongwangia sp. HRR-M8]|uniref:hypothetical protein n=1 Tax=Zunongwangia sp. HRR-M8 TaxID=3015170 RepID=UPI0022DE6B3F|nr:hypothetical protein [Zunongwangia sp. HRR-M8]WBL23421.1 hypothetical protein PBT89_05550 [Zunongwangia sp. HRR-M8]
MKKILAILIVISSILTSCKEEKKYTDYNENDFYEVQGIVTHAPLTDDPFDLPVAKDLHFEYFIHREKPLKGIEENFEILEDVKGFPVVILVHKNDETINFYDRIGLSENLSIDEKKILEEHFQEQKDIEKEKINKRN